MPLCPIQPTQEPYRVIHVPDLRAAAAWILDQYTYVRCPGRGLYPGKRPRTTSSRALELFQPLPERPETLPPHPLPLPSCARGVVPTALVRAINSRFSHDRPYTRVSQGCFTIDPLRNSSLTFFMWGINPLQLLRGPRRASKPKRMTSIKKSGKEVLGEGRS